MMGLECATCEAELMKNKGFVQDEWNAVSGKEEWYLRQDGGQSLFVGYHERQWFVGFREVKSRAVLAEMEIGILLRRVKILIGSDDMILSLRCGRGKG